MLARLRHHEDGDQEHDRGNRDGIDQGPEEGIAGAVLHRLGVGRCGDDGHETAAPAVADMVRHRNRGVADARGEELRQERPDRAVGHAHVVDQDHNDDHRHREVEGLGIGVDAERRVERVVRQGRQQHAAEDDRLPADLVREPAPEDERRGRDQERDGDDVARGEHVELLDRLEVKQRPELAAVPDAALSQHDHAGDDHVLEIAAHEGLAPRIGRGSAPCLDVLEDRRFTQREPDPDSDSDQEERHDEGEPPSPVVEGFVAQVSPRADDHGQREHDAERRRRLEPAGVVAAMLVLDMLGDVGDGAAVLPAEAEALDQAEDEEDEGRGESDRGVAGNHADEGRPHAHAGQRDDEGILPAHLIAEPAEEERPQRPDQEADREDRHGAEEGRDRVALLEELDREDRGQAAEDVEIVPLDDVADGCGNDDTA